MFPSKTEGKSLISSFSHASVYMHAGRPVCVFPDVDNQHISVTERAVDHEGIGPWFRPGSQDKIQGASP